MRCCFSLAWRLRGLNSERPASLRSLTRAPPGCYARQTSPSFGGGLHHVSHLYAEVFVDEAFGEHVGWGVDDHDAFFSEARDF